MTLLELLIQEFSVVNAQAFFRHKLNSFKADDDDFDHLFKDETFDKYESIRKIGQAILENDEIVFIASKTNDPLTDRSGKKKQYEIAKLILKHENVDAALFIFYDNNSNFRFSFVKANYLGTKRDYTDFKRYSYFVSPTQTNKTYIKQVGNCSFNTLDEIIKSFSVEPLNKAFYQEIATAFYGLIGGKIKINTKEISHDRILQLPSVDAKDAKRYQEFAVRLIGRTIFCWFLKNKKSDAGKALIPEEWLTSQTVIEVNNNQHNYYHAYLEKLFFLILNKKIADRKPYSLPNGHEDVPFLNGGLFEAQPDDFFPKNGKGIHQVLVNLVIPNEWFENLFKILEQYNFTIDENSINDSEVSIDPEMLGTIFENLLAEIDPDTEKSARKSTGSFYTPREIVDYMVEQSLLNYLKNKTGIDDEEQLQSLFKEGAENPFDGKQTKAILQALSDVKILDPACGSGAFPMGALHKIIVILKKLDKGADWWKQKQLEKIDNALVKKNMKEKLDQANSDYIRKLGVIQHSIYGVDIQPIASEISKLRSFLSLIIDENINDTADNRGVEPLPNLEFKFVTANTLIGLDEGSSHKTLALDFGETETLQNQLQEIRTNYLQTSGDEKEVLKKQFEKVQQEIFSNELKSGGVTNKKAQQLVGWKPFTNNGSNWFDPLWMFGVDKFDIVIGNPPWGAKLSTSDKDLYKLIYPQIDSSTPNSFAYFCGAGLKFSNSILTYVLPDSILIKDFNKTRELIQNDLNQIFWYLNTGIPEQFRPFVHVEHDVCVLILNMKKNEKSCAIKKQIYDFEKKQLYIDSYNVNKTDFIYKEQSSNFNLIIKQPEILLYKKLRNYAVLSEKVQIHEGIHTGNSRGILFHEKKINSHCKPLFHGGRAGDKIENFSSTRGKWYVDYRNTIINKDEGFYASLRDERIFTLPKLFITRTGNPFKVFYDDNNYASNNFFSLQMIKYEDNNEDILKSILPILLSDFANYFVRTYCAPRLGDTFIETKIIHLLKIPIPKILFESIKIQNTLKDIVNKIIELKNLEKDYSKEENEINYVIYKLYELSFNEVLLIDSDFKMSQTEYDNYKIA